MPVLHQKKGTSPSYQQHTIRNRFPQSDSDDENVDGDDDDDDDDDVDCLFVARRRTCCTACLWRRTGGRNKEMTTSKEDGMERTQRKNGRGGGKQ